MANEKDKVIVTDVVDETEKTTESEAPKKEEATEEKVGLLKRAKGKISDWWTKPSASPKEKFEKAAKVGAVIGLGVVAYAVGKKVQETKEFAALEESTETPALPGDTDVEEVVDYVEEPVYEEVEYAE